MGEAGFKVAVLAALYVLILSAVTSCDRQARVIDDLRDMRVELSRK